MVGFNRFGYNSNREKYGQTQGLQGKANLMSNLIKNDLLTNNTVQFDMNPMIDQNGQWLKSYISYNGLNYTNIKSNKVYYFDNLLEDSKWVVNLQGATLNNKNIFRKFRGDKTCYGVIATASPTLKVPF